MLFRFFVLSVLLVQVIVLGQAPASPQQQQRPAAAPVTGNRAVTVVKRAGGTPAAVAAPAPAPQVRTCPADVTPCSCTNVPNGLPILDCSRILEPSVLRDTTSPLRKVPPMKFSQIMMENSVLELLPTRAFGAHHADEYLFRDDQDLEHILRGAFGVNANPKKIIIERSGIATFPFEDLAKMTNLQEFTMIGTSIVFIPPGAFASIPNSILTTINLEQNEIMDIGEGAFDKLLKLHTLNLAENALIELPAKTMTFANNFRLLNLSHNEIQKVERSAFGAGFPHTLDLSFNAIPMLPSQPWSAFASAIGKHPNRQSPNMNLADNPITCNCQIRWLYNGQPALKNTITGVTCADFKLPVALFNLPASHFSNCPKPAVARRAGPAAAGR